MFRNHLKETIRRKLRGLLSSGICLQRHNNRLHTARHNVQQILDLNLAMLRRPPYSPDLAFPYLHFFWALKTPYLDVISDPMRRLRRRCKCDRHSNQRRLLPRNLYSPGTLEQVCRRRWGLHWRLSLYRVYLCWKSIYIIFLGFRTYDLSWYKARKCTVSETSWYNGVIY